MSVILVSPLSRIAEMAVRHGASEMISLMAKDHSFHRPGIIRKDRHLQLAMNDIAFKGTGNLIAPDDDHVTAIIEFARTWDRQAPLLIHCWMGVSRSPAAALVAALAVDPEQDDAALVLRLRAAAPQATPNKRIIEIADRLLERQGGLIEAVTAIGRGADANGDSPFIFHPFAQPYQGGTFSEQAC